MRAITAKKLHSIFMASSSAGPKSANRETTKRAAALILRASHTVPMIHTVPNITPRARARAARSATRKATRWAAFAAYASTFAATFAAAFARREGSAGASVLCASLSLLSSLLSPYCARSAGFARSKRVSMRPRFSMPAAVLVTRKPRR